MTPSTPSTFAELVDLLVGLINIAIPTLFSFVFVYLVWKVFDSWVIHGGDEAKRLEGRQYATAAVVVFVVMIGAWGFVTILRNTLF